MSIKKARKTLQNKEKFNFGILDEVANSGRYNAGTLPYPVKDGMLEIEIGPDSSMIFEEKQLDF